MSTADIIADDIFMNSPEITNFHSPDRVHDETMPSQMWFQHSDEGLILFIVFFCQACRWGRCCGCNLSSMMSRERVSCEALKAQIDRVFRDPEVATRRESICKVIVSNNGSVLDRETFPSEALDYLLCQLHLKVPNLRVLSIETRPEYAGTPELDFIARVLARNDSRVQVEIAIGFEAFDDRVRNGVFNKGLSLDTFERFVSVLARYGYRLKCYFMQKPVPGVTDAEAVRDIRNAIDYLARIAIRHGIRVNMHLNPTYVAVGTIVEEAFRAHQYTPPRLRDVARAARHAKGKALSVFVGLDDEGLAVAGGSFIREGDQELVKELDRFNRTQSFDILDRICESVDPAVSQPARRMRQSSKTGGRLPSNATSGPIRMRVLERNQQSQSCQSGGRGKRRAMRRISGWTLAGRFEVVAPGYDAQTTREAVGTGRSGATGTRPSE